MVKMLSLKTIFAVIWELEISCSEREIYEYSTFFMENICKIPF